MRSCPWGGSARLQPRSLRRLAFLTLAAAAGIQVAMVTSAAAAPSTSKVLILGSTVAGGASSLEAQAVTAAGLTPEVATAAQWGAMSTVDFAQYRAVVIGDPDCESTSSHAAAAKANASTWAAAATGNVVIISTDPVYHAIRGRAGANTLITKAMAFAVSDAAHTGAYVSTSCENSTAAAGTPQPLLAGFGTFTAKGTSCAANVKIVATHPALAGLTDADLSNWGCSTHGGFDSFPAGTTPTDFAALAMAIDVGGNYTAPDGTKGFPYILARGVSVSDIFLSPATTTANTGTLVTLTATILNGGTPVPGQTVTFTVSGANPGTFVAGASTDAAGAAVGTYTGTVQGTDTVVASFTAGGVTQSSNSVTVIWEVSNGIPVAPDVAVNVTDCVAGATFDPGASDPDGDPLTYTFGATTLGAVTGTSPPFVYVPNTGVTAGAETFTYTVSDGKGGTATGAVNAVIACNQPPTAADVKVKVEKNSKHNPVKLAGTDPDGDVLTYSYTQPSHGTVTGTGPKVHYTPNKGFVGTDAFVYTVDDGHGGTASATVTVIVRKVDHDGKPDHDDGKPRHDDKPDRGHDKPPPDDCDPDRPS